MNTGKTMFAQIMEFVPWTSFTRIVARYGGDSGVRRLSCTEQFRAMAFAQLTYRESLRDIEACLLVNQSNCTAWACYRFCRSLFSRKLSYSKPPQARVTLLNRPTSITN